MNRNSRAFGVIIFFIIIFISFHFGCGSGNTDGLDQEIKNLVGKKYIYPESTKIIEKYGSPQTLSGTDNSKWVAYFPKGNFTIINDKKTDTIKRVLPGKRPQ